MEKQKLVIAEGNEEFAKALAEVLRERYELRLSREGVETLELIRSFKPDVVILDLMLPGLDGITLLERVAKMGQQPMVLATSRFVSDYVSETIARLGVCYVMREPCQLQATVDRVVDLSARARQPRSAAADTGISISNILLALGIPAKLRGYAYLREAVAILAERPGLSVTKELYPEVGQRCQAGAINVERSIRSAIEGAWKRRDALIWQQYLGTEDLPVTDRLSNAEFITRLANYLNQKRD